MILKTRELSGCVREELSTTRPFQVKTLDSTKLHQDLTIIKFSMARALNLTFQVLDNIQITRMYTLVRRAFPRTGIEP